MDSKINLLGTSVIILVFVMLTSSQLADAAVFIKIDGIKGDVKVAGPANEDGWFPVDSLSFGVERELKESGEKGDTEDINIGIGELQEFTITKPKNSASAKLAQFSINGNSIGEVDVCVTEGFSPEGNPACYLHYKLDRVFVKSWKPSSESDDRPREEVSFFFNKIAFAYASTNNLKNEFENDGEMSWDKIRNIPWLAGLVGIFDIIFPPASDSDKDGVPDDIETILVGDSESLDVTLQGLVKGVQASHDSTTQEINLKFKNTDGAFIFEITLPPGTHIDENGFTAYAELVDGFYIVKVTGLIPSYPPGKTITLNAATFATTVCIVDDSSEVVVGDIPECTGTDTLISQVLLDCDGFTRTFTDFPESPSSRDYSCTKFFDDANTFFIVEGLAYSSVGVVCNDPANLSCGVDSSGPAVGGSLITIDTISLLLVGTQLTVAWLVPVIVSAVGIGIVFLRRK